MDLAADELQGGEVFDLAGVQAGLKREVELVEGFVVRQPGQFQSVAEPAALAQADLFLEEQVDEVEVAHLGGLGAVDELGDGVGQVGQAEPGGVVTDPVGGQPAHEFSFVVSGRRGGCSRSGAGRRHAQVGVPSGQQRRQRLERRRVRSRPPRSRAVRRWWRGCAAGRQPVPVGRGRRPRSPRRVARGWVASHPPPSTVQRVDADPVSSWPESGWTCSCTRWPGPTWRAGTE